MRKREEARITDALDAKRMVNVAIAEAPLVPGTPAHSPAFLALLALAFMSMMSIGVVGGVEYLDKTLHSPRDVERHLQIPVLAAVPDHSVGTLLPGRS